MRYKIGHTKEEHPQVGSTVYYLDSAGLHKGDIINISMTEDGIVEFTIYDLADNRSAIRYDIFLTKKEAANHIMKNFPE